MAGSVNKAILLGTIGKDPTRYKFSNGNAVVNFSMATSESWKDKDGEKQEKTQWHNIAIYNENVGDIVMNYAKKGDKIYVEGQMQTREYEKEGVAQRTTDIVVRGFQGIVNLIGRVEKREMSQENDYSSRYKDSPRKTTTTRHDLDDEIPF